jgi:D-alanyl-lipoteichoic acid acyltransferase DltB (MBOAT superfamily)
MLFNSNEFLLVFLPATLVAFYWLGSVSRKAAIVWLIFASLAFYAWWRPINVLIIAPSIIINFALVRALLRLAERGASERWSQAILLVGITFNILFLGYFKYLNFIFDSINDVFGANLVLTHIILPLGISFITFQKIAFLIDVQAGRVQSVTFLDYCIFVLFFPQLVAGPIVHYREMMPQFHAASCRFDKEDVAVGITLLSFGLFKKVVLADKIALVVTPLYDHIGSEGGTSFLTAWMAAIGFTLQIYFDFSGYTDMALGLARFFGIRLPQNFDSPLRASSIIDFWLRWHMTLTRFLTAYIYNPLSLWLTRRRLAKGKSAYGGRSTTVGSFVYLLMFPIVLTMLISGLWHGAGYGFIIWGLLHGCYLTINHGWRVTRARLWPSRVGSPRFAGFAGVALTFASVAFAMVFFRAPTVALAMDLVKGMLGVNGVALPQEFLNGPGYFSSTLRHIGVAPESLSMRDFEKTVLWIGVLMFIALACPNTLEILAKYEPALGVKPKLNRFSIGAIVEWRASLPWAIAVSAIAAAAMASTGGPSEFLYWQF